MENQEKKTCPILIGADPESPSVTMALDASQTGADFHASLHPSFEKARIVDIFLEILSASSSMKEG
jgi:hypothetical protein